MSTEMEEKRYICKICSKSCVSGRSLGGHMRLHLAFIAASKAKAKIDTDSESYDDQQCGMFQLEEHSGNQSNSDQETIKKFDGNIDLADDEEEEKNGYGLRNNPKKSWRINQCGTFQLEEMIKNCENGGFGDDDDPEEDNGYGLRNNPKKSRRIAEPKHGSSSKKKKRFSCKQCGKVFVSSRAISGHMRCHSMKKNMELFHCRECEQGFGSMSALCGHMKTHSKKSREYNESADDHHSLAKMEVLQEESVMDLKSLCPVRRKRSKIRYSSTPNASFFSLNASSSLVETEFGEVEEAAICLMMLSRGVKNWNEFVSDYDSAYLGVESFGKGEGIAGYNGGITDSYFSDRANVSFDKTFPKFDDPDSREMMKIEGQFGITDGFKESDESADDTSLEYADDTSLESAEGSDSKECNDIENDPDNAVKTEILALSKSKGYVCHVCFKAFSTGQALGGHKRAHYTGSKAKEDDLFDLNIAADSDEDAEEDVELAQWWAWNGQQCRAIGIAS